ncbi:MAG TPA: Gfo/Idh/MocA family oxidoreductase [Gryllotalpicola sp.]
MTTADRRVRLGIIGLGLITQSRHLPSLSRQRERFELVRVCDLSAEVARGVAAAHGGIPWGTSAAELLADPEVDAVLICTPGAHSALARAALERGKHVFAEKPYAYDPAVAEADAAYAAEHRLVLQVGYMKMYEPAVAAARAAFGEIGPVRVARLTVLHPSDERQTTALQLLRGADVDPETLAEATAANRAEVAAALAPHPGADPMLVRNVLFGSVCHDIALLRALFPGETADVLAAVPDAPSAQRIEPPRLQLTGRLSGGASWTLSWNWLADFPEYREWVEVLGDRGSVRIELPAPYGGAPSAIVAITRQGADGGVEERRIDPGGPDAFERELVAFAASVRSGAPVLSDARGAAADARLLLTTGALLAD